MVDGWVMVGWVDGKMDRRMCGWMDGSMEGRKGE